MRLNKSSLLLYAVTDRRWLAGETLSERLCKAIDGGVTFVQMREKKLPEAEFFREAVILKELCRRRDVPFVINDNVEVALAIDADGVHVGQSDISASEARRRIGADKILGVSAQTPAAARLAEEAGADYLGVGALFATDTKSDADAVSLQTLKEICASVKIPVIAIGGICAENMPRLVGSGVCGVALVSALFAPHDTAAAAAKLRRLAEECFLIKK